MNLEYTLFDGLGRLYNYRSLKETYNLSKLEARETIENTVLQLFSVYYEVARLTKNVEILEQTLEISRNRVKRAGYQFDYGQNTKLEVLNAEVDVTNDSINLNQLLRNSEIAMNYVKNNGKNNFKFYKHEIKESLMKQFGNLNHSYVHIGIIYL